MHTSLPVPVKDVVFTDFDDGDGIIVDLTTRQYYQLNETAALIWMSLEKRKAVEDIVTEIQSLYEVNREQAIASVDKFVGSLESNNLVTAADVSKIHGDASV